MGVFVCTHGQRDARCGFHGTRIAQIFQKCIQEENVGNIRIFQVSHIGGHKVSVLLSNLFLIQSCAGEGALNLSCLPEESQNSGKSASLDSVTDCTWINPAFQHTVS